ncbi:MAG: RlmE family RNA methyltransferase [Geminicoccaceae bacterium]
MRSARGRPLQSTRWLERQLNDPYVHRARAEGFRARSAYKLLEIDRKHQLLKRGALVLDLGAAPGSWTQVASRKGCRIVAVDLVPVDPVERAHLIQGDVRESDTQQSITRVLGGRASLILSDMAPAATGQKLVDRLKSEELSLLVFDLCETWLEPGGRALVKLVKGAESAVRTRALESFKTTAFIRPPATRSDSSETFLLASGFRGPNL